MDCKENRADELRLKGQSAFLLNASCANIQLETSAEMKTAEKGQFVPSFSDKRPDAKLAFLDESDESDNLSICSASLSVNFHKQNVPVFRHNPPPPDSEIAPSSEPAEKQETEPKPQRFRQLASLLKAYLFGTLKKDDNFYLSQREFEIMKFLLKRKILYSKSAFRNKRIDDLTKDDLVAFLRDNPPRKRIQIFKRRIFTTFFRFHKKRGVDVIQRFFQGDQNFNYRQELTFNKGNFTNQFFKSCFRNESFRECFIESVKSPEFWEFGNRRCLHLFEQNIEEWLEQLDAQAGLENFTEQTNLLLKIKFLPFTPEYSDVIRSFKKCMT